MSHDTIHINRGDEAGHRWLSPSGLTKQVIYQPGSILGNISLAYGISEAHFKKYLSIFSETKLNKNDSSGELLGKTVHKEETFKKRSILLVYPYTFPSIALLLDHLPNQ